MGTRIPRQSSIGQGSVAALATPPVQDGPATSTSRWRWNRVAWLAVIAILVIAAILAVVSDGVVQDDEVTHYLIARASWQDWRSLLSIWGRPGCTFLYALVAGIGDAPAGFRAVRLLTVAIVAATAWFTFVTARRAGLRHPALAPALLLLMPTVFTYSFTPTTEAAAALYLVAAAACLARGHLRISAILLALLPVTRHELVVLLVPMAIYFLLRRDLVAALLLGWAELSLNAVAYFIGMRLPILRFHEPRPAELYGYGNPFTYLLRWVQLSGTTIAILSVVGIVILAIHVYRTRAGRKSPGAVRRWWLYPLLSGGCAGMILVHTLLYMFNRFASGGYARFLIPIAPMLAICACFGLARIVSIARSSAAEGSALSQRRWRRFGALAAVAGAVVALIPWLAAARPHRLCSHQHAIAEGMNFVRERYPGSRVVGNTSWIWFFQRGPDKGPPPPAEESWIRGGEPRPVYFYDMSHSTTISLAWLTGFPNELVKEIRIPEFDPVKDPPYLRIFRRLPGERRSEGSPDAAREH